MKKEKIIKHLEDLAEHCETMIDRKDPDCVWIGDVEALQYAIDKLSNEYSGTDPRAVIKEILAKEGMNQQQLADNAGMIRQGVSQALTNSSSRYETIKRLVEALGYEIVIRKK